MTNLIDQPMRRNGSATVLQFPRAPRETLPVTNLEEAARTAFDRLTGAIVMDQAAKGKLHPEILRALLDGVGVSS